VSAVPFTLAHAAAAAAIVGANEPALIERIVAAMLANGWPALPDAAARAYNPLWAYEAGGIGPLYDPSDMTKLWLDTAGTVPVENDGELVARMDDVHGTAHVIQADPTKQPIYDLPRGRLLFDGVNDYLVSAAVDFTAWDSAFAAAGLRKQSDAAAQVAFMIGTGVANNGIFYMRGPHVAAGTSWQTVARGTANSVRTTSGFAAPHSAVLSLQMDISADTHVSRINGASESSIATDQGTGNLGNYVVAIGATGAGATPFNGYFSGGMICTGAVSAGHRNACEAWLKVRAGELV
jgi:hypothetical protein